MIRTVLKCVGLAAMVPAAINPALAAATGPSDSALTLLVCSGDGVARTVTMPVEGSDDGPQGSTSACCAKGCHSSQDRKKGQRKAN